MKSKHIIHAYIGTFTNYTHKLGNLYRLQIFKIYITFEKKVLVSYFRVATKFIFIFICSIKNININSDLQKYLIFILNTFLLSLLYN